MGIRRELDEADRWRELAAAGSHTGFLIGVAFSHGVVFIPVLEDDEDIG